jgi:acyl-CoA synthetase (AMP-forming)/AMP-acid ligase II
MNRISQLAGGMVAKLRFKPGDRLAILDENCVSYLELFFVLDKAGLEATPLNWR